MVWFFNNDDQNQCQERVQAATEQNPQKETLSIDQKIKKKRLKKKQQFFDDQEHINSIQKKKAKDFWNYLRNKKKNKRCEDEERNWFWTFGIWNTWNGEKYCDK